MSVQPSVRDLPSPRSLATAGLPPRVRRSLERALAEVSTALDPLLTAMIDAFEQELFRLADHARNPGLESGYMQALRTFRLNRADLLPHFLMTIESSLARLRTPAPPVATTPSADNTTAFGSFGALSLVEDAVMDEGTVLREIATRQEGRANLTLHLLGQRFGVLAAAPGFDAERIPLGPQCLCRAIQATALALHIEYDARVLLYRMFDRVVMAGYARVLERLDTTLAESGILPALTYVPMRTRNAAPVDASIGTTQAERAPARGPPAPRQTDASQPPAAPPAANAAQRPFTTWSGDLDAQATGTVEDHDTAYRRLEQLMSGRRELLQKFRPRADEHRPRQALPTRELTDALHGLQSKGRTAAGLTEIKQSLLAQARQRTGEAAVLAPQDEDVFELLAMLYGHLEEEIRSDAPSATLVRDLQIPLLRVALQDHSFFTRQAHPARQLLNTVAESAARWIEEPAADPRLLVTLRHAVAHVIEHYQDDPQVFADGNAQLQAQLLVQTRTAELQERRHIEAARGKEKLEAAKLRAAEVLRNLIGDLRIPRFSRSLLDQAWADVMTLTLLRHGEDSDAWRRQQAATHRIVETAVRGDTLHDPELQAHIEESLAQVGYHAEEAGVIAQRLTHHAVDDDDASSRTELAMKLKARARLGADAEQSRRPQLPPRTPDEQLHYETLRTLPFGTWFEFVTNQQGDVIRRRMSWFSPLSDNALFVNQRGQRVGEHSLDTVARQLAIGNARIVTADRGHLVDRAWQAAIGALRSFAGRSDAARKEQLA